MLGPTALLFRVVAGFERQLDTDQREFLGGQGHARDAENVDLEAALERDHHYDGAVHQCEGGDTHAGGKPVGAATGRNRGSHAHQGGHWIVG